MEVFRKVSKIPVFDIGDTLIPSNREINNIVQNHVDEEVEFPINDYNIYRPEEIEEWLDKNGLEADPEEVRDAYLERKDEIFEESGVLEELKKIHARFGPIGFISDNSKEAKKYYLDLFDRKNLDFKGFVVSGEVGAKKPSPKIFEAFLEKRDEPASRFIYFGNRVDRDSAAEEVGLGFVQVTEYDTFGPVSNQHVTIDEVNFIEVGEVL